jgi:hypothetical protein
MLLDTSVVIDFTLLIEMDLARAAEIFSHLNSYLIMGMALLVVVASFGSVARKEQMCTVVSATVWSEFPRRAVVRVEQAGRVSCPHPAMSV